MCNVEVGVECMSGHLEGGGGVKASLGLAGGVFVLGYKLKRSLGGQTDEEEL